MDDSISNLSWEVYDVEVKEENEKWKEKSLTPFIIDSVIHRHTNHLLPHQIFMCASLNSVGVVYIPPCIHLLSHVFFMYSDRFCS